MRYQPPEFQPPEFQPPEFRTPELRVAQVQSPPAPWHEGWRSDTLRLAIALLVALLVLYTPFMHFILSPLVIIVHELGHAATGWLVGCPGIPAFDFTHGGGAAPCLEQAPASIWLYRLLFAGGCAWLCWQRRFILAGTLLVLAIIHHFIFTSIMHEVVLVYMGHGTVLIIGGIFFWRGLSVSLTRSPTDCTTHLFAGLLLLGSDARFFHMLASDAETMRDYVGGKDGEAHDLVKLAWDLLPSLTHSNWEIASLARFQSSLCLLLPLVIIGAEISRRILRARQLHAE